MAIVVLGTGSRQALQGLPAGSQRLLEDPSEQVQHDQYQDDDDEDRDNGQVALPSDFRIWPPSDLPGSLHAAYRTTRFLKLTLIAGDVRDRATCRMLSLARN